MLLTAQNTENLKFSMVPTHSDRHPTAAQRDRSQTFVSVCSYVGHSQPPILFRLPLVRLRELLDLPPARQAYKQQITKGYEQVTKSYEKVTNRYTQLQTVTNSYKQ